MTTPTTLAATTGIPAQVPVATDGITVTVPTTTADGISSAPSTLTSAGSAPSASPGFSAKISAWVSSIVDAIRNCLANLPGIGKFFAVTAPILPPVATGPNANPTTWTQAEIVNQISSQFVSTNHSAASTAAIPTADVVDHCLTVFRQIEAPADLIGAFQTVLCGSNSNDPIARQFYDALPENLQTDFRRRMYDINGSSTINGVDYQASFGQHMVDTAIRGPLALEAVEAQLAALRSTPVPPAVTTPAVTTPAETTPAETTPAVTTPAVTTPAETTPATP